MKKLVFLSLMFMGLLLPQNIHAQTAKAIWCEGNSTLYFTYDATYDLGGTIDGQTITSIRSVDINITREQDVPWWDLRNSITRVVVTESFSDFKPSSMAYWFYICRNLTTITGLSNINTSNLDYMRHVFDGCSSLTSLDFTGWNSSFKPRYMEYMFKDCSSLTSINGISNWDTSNLFSLYATFMGCSSLISLDLSGWDTSKIEDLHFTFWGCHSLTSIIGIGNWNISNVETLSATFSGCRSLTSIDDLGSWDTSKVRTMNSTFASCTGLTSFEVLRNWDTSNLWDLSDAFAHCTGLTSLDAISNWDTSKVTSLCRTFIGCTGLTSIDEIRGWDMSHLDVLSSAFEDCTGLTLVDLSDWDNSLSSQSAVLNGTFNGCTNLRGVVFGEKLRILGGEPTFEGCPNLRYIDCYNYPISDVTDIPNFFMGFCQGLPSDYYSYYTSFDGVPETTVIYLPKGISSEYDVSEYGLGVISFANNTNVVYSNNSDGTDLRCPKYYSIDKVDIEFPRDFKTNEAVYSRTMGSKEYGSVVLPYDFTSNDDIQAYSLSEQYNNMSSLKFTDTQTVPAHTPFAFKRLNNAEFLMKDDSGNFGITVHATRSTNAAEKTLLATGDLIDGSPYEGTTGLSNWKTKGYYVKETVTDYDGMYFIQDNNFKRATGNLNLVDHRVLFYPTDATGASKFFTLSFSDDEMITAIEAAETEQTLRQAEGIYDASGRQQTTAHRGLNIVRMSDGTVKKVIVK